MTANPFSLLGEAACLAMLAIKKHLLEKSTKELLHRELGRRHAEDDACGQAWILQALRELGQEPGQETLEDLCHHAEEMLNQAHYTNDYRVHVCLAILLDLCREVYAASLTEDAIEKYVQHLKNLAPRVKMLNPSAGYLLEAALAAINQDKYPKPQATADSTAESLDQDTCTATLRHALHSLPQSCTQAMRLAEACTSTRPRTPQQLYNHALAVAMLHAYTTRMLERTRTRAKSLIKHIQLFLKRIIELARKAGSLYVLTRAFFEVLKRLLGGS